MSSRAAKANQKIRQQVQKGASLQESAEAVLKQEEAETAVHKERLYAKFPDHSFLEVVYRDHYGNEYAGVLTDNSGRSNADKIIKGIRARCHQCGKEVWCDMDGRAAEQNRFELPGAEIVVCRDCQRNLIVRALTGE